MRKITMTLIMLGAISVSAQVKKGKLIWEENFNGKKLDEKAWNFELGDGCPNVCGWGNNERQLYTKDNHTVKDGFLTITAKKDGDKYTSTRITTAGKKEFKYGYIEARAKIPTGHGIWPAFWMLGSNIGQKGWPLAGEIDILEYIGREPDMAYTTLHFQDRHGDNAFGHKTLMPEIEEGFHNYAVRWTPEKIDFLVDEKIFFSYAPENKNEANWPYNQPFYIILNVAVGGNFGGPDVDDSIFPQDYVIDYIKVYSN
ncbi:glycoside hydrolase family 16 protein [Flavobacterium sp. DGU11]|uniref:Glycoside hydrolase family 16 protein n=1 Tax=Flavobacterium arundinis TaxID=3139143 RepID=A0ABU9HY10_9FLAO